MIKLLRGYKPEWLYSLLPYLYIVAGLFTVMATPTLIGAISSAALIIAGLHVLAMRRKHRRSGAGKPDGDPDEHPDAQPHLLKITLGESNECGHPVIDSQHRNLCASGNALLDAIIFNHGVTVISTLLADIEHEFREHFRTEETILRDVDPDFAARHQREHEALLGKITTIIAHCRAGQMDIREIIDFIAYDFITEHIAKEDKRYFSLVA